MAEPLSSADRSSLAAERGSINMSVAGLLVLDADPELTLTGLRERVAERIHLVPRLRQRLAEPAMGLAQPVWVDDETFDLDWHVRRLTVASPGDRKQLAALVGQEMSDRLDRSRALWRMWIVEGVEGGGRTAVLFKLHHSIADGLAALAAGAIILDPTPEPMLVPPPDEDWSPRGYDVRSHLLTMATGSIARAQKLMLEGAARALDTSPRRAAGDVIRTTELLGELARTRPQAPMTPINHPITPGRSYAMARGELADLKRVAAAAGATVNDVVLGAVAGMLRSYLPQAGWGMESRRDPVALVPVSVRGEGDEGQLGNRISMVFVDLPVREPDPLARVRAINATTRTLKASAAVRAGALVVGVGGWTPPLVSGMVARAMGSVRAMNLVVSNVPGPQIPFYLRGARLREVYPIVPLNPANQGLSVGIVSYDGGVFFGLLGDRALDPPPAVAAAALEQALAELVAAAGEA